MLFENRISKRLRFCAFLTTNEASPTSDLQTLFYNLIQSQTEKMMLANVRKNMFFKTIDPATVPEKKSEPKRALICILGAFLGEYLSLIFFYHAFYRKRIKFRNNSFTN